MRVGREPDTSDIQLHKSSVKTTTATNKIIAILCEGERQAGPDAYTDLPSETHFTGSALTSHQVETLPWCHLHSPFSPPNMLSLPCWEGRSSSPAPLLLAQGSSEVPPPAALTLRKASRWALPHRASHLRAGRQERAKQIRARTPPTSQENSVSQQAASPLFPLRDSEALLKHLLLSSPLYPLYYPSFLNFHASPSHY